MGRMTIENGVLYLSKRQITLLSKGKEVPIWRERRRIILRPTEKCKKARMIKKQIANLRKELKQLA